MKNKIKVMNVGSAKITPDLTGQTNFVFSGWRFDPPVNDAASTAADKAEAITAAMLHLLNSHLRTHNPGFECKVVYKDDDTTSLLTEPNLDAQRSSENEMYLLLNRL